MARPACCPPQPSKERHQSAWCPCSSDPIELRATARGLLGTSWRRLRRHLPAVLAVAALSDGVMFLLHRLSHRLTNAGATLSLPCFGHLTHLENGRTIRPTRMHASDAALLKLVRAARHQMYAVQASAETVRSAAALLTAASTIAAQWQWRCWAGSTRRRRWATCGTSAAIPASPPSSAVIAALMRRSTSACVASTVPLLFQNVIDDISAMFALPACCGWLRHVSLLVVPGLSRARPRHSPLDTAIAFGRVPVDRGRRLRPGAAAEHHPADVPDRRRHARLQHR